VDCGRADRHDIEIGIPLLNGIGAFVSNKTKCLAQNESMGRRQRNEEKLLSINVTAIGIG
jgi:hypothetical protein